MKTEDEFVKEITNLAAKAESPEKAIEKIIEAYPEIDAGELKKQFAIASKEAEDRFYEKRDSEEAKELSDADLESVAGGSFSSWMKKNWPYVLGVSVIAISAFGYGIWKGSPSRERVADADRRGKVMGASTGKKDGYKAGVDAANTVVQGNLPSLEAAVQSLNLPS